MMPSAKLQLVFVQRKCKLAARAERRHIDTSHFGCLHTGSVQPDDVLSNSPLRWTVTNQSPVHR
jgi:phthalate 4,5-dioxygenase